jgi:hypothetical protein
MAKTNNPTVSEPVVSQEPVSEGLEEAAEVTVEGTGAEAVQPESKEKDTVTEKVEKEQAKGVDLNKAIAKLTPAEQKAYKAFQGDYTKKSQAAAEYETYYKNLMADPEFVAFAKSKQEKAKVEAEKQPDFSKMNDEEIFNYTVDKRVDEKLTKYKEEVESKYGGFINESLVKQGNKLIDDFAEEKKIDVEDVRELAKYAVEHKVTLDEAYKVAYFDKIPEQAKQEALEDLDLKKKANLELGSTPTGVAPVMPEKPTIAEAAKLAEKMTGLKW